jgi:hypothetical protein
MQPSNTRERRSSSGPLLVDAETGSRKGFAAVDALEKLGKGVVEQSPTVLIVMRGVMLLAKEDDYQIKVEEFYLEPISISGSLTKSVDKQLS